MKLLEDRIRAEGKIFPGDILKVDSFINHQLDVLLLDRLGEEIFKRYSHAGVTKILTIEASGIGIACLCARYFGVPVVFAKKSRTSNLSPDIYLTDIPSYTHGNVNHVMVSKSYLCPGEKVLIVDDFLATGAAVVGLADICKQAKADIVGAAILIEKSYQSGAQTLSAMGIRVESLARIGKMNPPCDIEFLPDITH